MALDLMRCALVGDTLETFAYQTVPAFWLIARLCEEAGVCLHDAETKPVEIHAATWDVDNGLVVQDEVGRKYRLKVKAKQLHA